MQNIANRGLLRLLKFFCALFLLGNFFLFPGCKDHENKKEAAADHLVDPEINAAFADTETQATTPEEFNANSFDFPVGKPDAKGYYNAQAFGKNNHLGDDWNAVTGGNSDLGHPIYAIANGKVAVADDLEGGWGKVVRIVHTLPDGEEIESIYAHCDSIMVLEGDRVRKGFQIGTIGTAGGQYLAHLHLEIRDSIHMPIGGGYSEVQEGYLDPSLFIKNNRSIH